MKKIIVFILAIINIFSMLGCKKDTPPIIIDGGVKEEYYELMYDKKFEHGIAVNCTKISEYNGGPIGYLDYNKTAKSYPEGLENLTAGNGYNYTWILGQFGSDYDITKPLNYEEITKTRHKYTDTSKSIEVDTNTGEFVMGIKGSKEFETPRTDPNQSWTGILLQHNPTKKVMIENIESLRIKMSFTIDFCDMKMTDEQFDPNLHTAHFVFNYFIMNYKNNDFFFAGFPLYDYRNIFASEFIAQDNPNVTETTGKFIYGAATKNFLQIPVEMGVKYDIDFDFLPLIKRGFDFAQRGNFMKDAELKNLGIDGFNIGWEIPGTFDVQSTVSNFEMLYKLKK